MCVCIYIGTLGWSHCLENLSKQSQWLYQVSNSLYWVRKTHCGRGWVGMSRPWWPRLSASPIDRHGATVRVSRRLVQSAPRCTTLDDVNVPGGSKINGDLHQLLKVQQNQIIQRVENKISGFEKSTVRKEILWVNNLSKWKPELNK